MSTGEPGRCVACGAEGTSGQTCTGCGGMVLSDASRAASEALRAQWAIEDAEADANPDPRTECVHCGEDFWADRADDHCRCRGVDTSLPLCPCRAPKDEHGDCTYEPEEHGWVSGWESLEKVVQGHHYELWWNHHGDGICIDGVMQSLSVEGWARPHSARVCWEIDHGFGLGDRPPRTILATDVHYHEDGSATAAGVAFMRWTDTAPMATYVSQVPADKVGPYVPGRFYLRELPCLRQLLQEHRLRPDILVVDAYCRLGIDPGLGAHLHNETRIPVVGVAKTRYALNGERGALCRGGSTKPVYVDSAGCSFFAEQAVARMPGPRIPTLLKLADTLARKGKAQGNPT